MVLKNKEVEYVVLDDDGVWVSCGLIISRIVGNVVFCVLMVEFGILGGDGVEYGY